MTNISMDMVKELREMTGISVMQCRKALEEAGGDKDKAIILLRKKGAEIASKKGDRTLGAGIVASYVHSNKTLGAMVELMSETDFVANTPEFSQLAYDIAMQVSATRPDFIKKEEINEADKARALEVFTKEVEGKPAEMREKILQGKLDAYFKDKILLEQSFIKNPDLTIGQMIENAVQKFGEKIEVARFARMGIMGR
jgi:elongation factor Ts